MQTESSTSVQLRLLALQTLPPPPAAGRFEETLQATEAQAPEPEPALEGDALLASFIDLL